MDRKPEPTNDGRTNFELRDPLPAKEPAVERVARIDELLQLDRADSDLRMKGRPSARGTIIDLARRELGHLLCHRCNGWGKESCWGPRGGREWACEACHGSGFSAVVREAIQIAEGRRARSERSKEAARGRRAAKAKAEREFRERARRG